MKHPEAQRLAVLFDYRLLDTPREPAYDRIVDQAADVCNVPLAVFTLVDEDSVFFKAAFGTKDRSTDRSCAMCGTAVSMDAPLIIEDLTTDERYADTPFVQAGFRFYAGVQVKAETGENLGTLCVMDQRPRVLEPIQFRFLEQMVQEIEARIELHRRLIKLQTVLDERAILAAMVAHDARNLLTQIMGPLEWMRSESEAGAELAGDALDATRQIVRMFNNVVNMDRTGASGLEIDRKEVDIREWFERVRRREARRARRLGITWTAEYQLTEDEKTTDLDILDRVAVNLVDNAFRSAERGGTVKFVLSEVEGGGVRLSVEDDGAGVPDDIGDRVFEPYFSRRTKSSNGAGLGLAFCRMAAQALDGDIQMFPADPGVRFQFTSR